MNVRALKAGSKGREDGECRPRRYLCGLVGSSLLGHVDVAEQAPAIGTHRHTGLRIKVAGRACRDHDLIMPLPEPSIRAWRIPTPICVRCSADPRWLLQASATTK